MASAAPARRATAYPSREPARTPRPAARRAPQARARAAHGSRAVRAFVFFVVCVSVLAAGRVALSFAVVQKSLQTDTIVRTQRQVAATNAQLAEDVAQRGSSVRINEIAENQLGLVYAEHITYLTAPSHGAKAGAGTAR